MRTPPGGQQRRNPRGSRAPACGSVQTCARLLPLRRGRLCTRTCNRSGMRGRGLGFGIFCPKPKTRPASAHKPEGGGLGVESQMFRRVVDYHKSVWGVNASTWKQRHWRCASPTPRRHRQRVSAAPFADGCKRGLSASTWDPAFVLRPRS